MSPAAWFLFATESDALSRVASRTRPGSILGWEGPAEMLAVGAIAAVTVWLASLWLRERQRRSKNSPLRMLKELATAHRLSRRELRLLARLVEHHHLVQPGLLFVEPRLWESETLSATMRPAQAAGLASLRDRLFARPSA